MDINYEKNVESNKKMKKFVLLHFTLHIEDDKHKPVHPEKKYAIKNSTNHFSLHVSVWDTTTK